jgi:hypothetical protein
VLVPSPVRLPSESKLKEVVVVPLQRLLSLLLVPGELYVVVPER